MTKLCDLLGSRPEALYECMYTKHKTQKRKIWHDGFVALYASRRIVVYEEDEGKAGKAIDETKPAQFDWDRKDEEHFETSKFLVEVVNETPVGSTPLSHAAAPASATSTNAFESASTAQQSAANGPGVRAGPPPGLGGRPRFSNSKFRTPLSRGPPRLGRPGASRAANPYSRSSPVNVPTPPTAASSPKFDFDRSPTSEWKYVPDVIARTPDEVLALLDK